MTDLIDDEIERIKAHPYRARWDQIEEVLIATGASTQLATMTLLGMAVGASAVQENDLKRGIRMVRKMLMGFERVARKSSTWELIDRFMAQEKVKIN